MVSSNFLKSNFVFSRDSKPVDYRSLTPFANMAGLSDIEEYAINMIEKKVINSIVSLPPVEQKIEMKDVAVLCGNSQRFINSVFCSLISDDNFSFKARKFKPSLN